MSDLAIDTWGQGTPVVLVHGSLATGAEEWQAQQPLAEEGFRLLVADRRGYGNSPAAEGEDFVRDADDIAELIEEGAHLVGHSYGGLAAMLAAARRPDSTRSLALLEPPAFTLARDEPATRDLVDDLRRLWNEDRPDEEWLTRFLVAVGTDPDELGAEALESVAPLVSLVRRGRPAWDQGPPVQRLGSASFPKLVVSGGHSTAFEAICDELAERIGASRTVVEGAGHEVQFTGPPLNEQLLDLWRRAA